MPINFRILALLFFAAVTCVAAEDAAPFVIAQFHAADDLKKVERDPNLVELTVGPRTMTDFNTVLKYVALKGDYPSFAFSPPKIPKDWSKYEVLSFAVWSNNDTQVCLRIDDAKSFNYNSRFNFAARVQRGKTVVQIETKNIAHTLDLSKMKLLSVFTDHPPANLTLWFDDFKLGKMEAQKVDFIPYAERFDLVPSLDIVSPHFALGKNLAGGPLNVFMLSSVKYGREVSEMMQRADFNVSLLSWDREWGVNTWGFGDFYGKRGDAIDQLLMQKYLDGSMQGPEKFHAMAMYTPLGWNHFTASARQAILKRVKENGEGLVLVMPFPGDKGQVWPEDLKEVCALVNSDSDFTRDGYVRYPANGRITGKKWVKAKDHPITQGVPIEALPFKHMETQKYELAPGAEVLLALESGEPVLAVRQVGKGRVVTFATRALSLTPTMNVPTDFVNAPPHRYWEAWYSLLDRAVIWAGGREFKRDGASVDLAPNQYADPYFTPRQWKDAAGKVTDWELVFKDPQPALKRVELKADDVLKHGDTISATFSAPDGTADATWSAALGEFGGDTWRTLEEVAVNAASGKVELATTRVRQNICYVKLTAKRKGELIAEGRAEVALTPDPVWDDYQTFTWLEGGLPFLFELEMKRMRELGVTGNTVGPRDIRMIKTLFRGGMLVHPVGLTQGLHVHDLNTKMKAFRETGNKANLIREPSYADEAFVAKEREQSRKYGAELAKFSPLSMILSDETALTSYTAEFDFDFHPQNIKNFQQKLTTKFGTIDALNAALHLSAKSFETIVPPTSDEAKASGNFGLWNEWRAHNDDMWTGAFKMYGAALKETYPQSRLSVSGTQEQAVFNGIDWAKLTPVFGAVCGYGGRFQELQRLSYQNAPGDLKATPWGAYGRSGRAVDYQIWNSLVTGGDGHALFWWYSLRNPDLTFSQSARDYQRAIAEMRGGIGKQYMQAQRRFSPVAILWSANSQRASWTLGKFDAFKKAEAAVMEALTDAEFDPCFISEQQIADGALSARGIRAVVLPMSFSLSKNVVAALDKLAVDGGAVVVTDMPQFDEFLQPVKLPESLETKLVKFSDVKSDLVPALAKAGVKPWVTIRGGGQKIKKINATLHTIPGAETGRLLTILRAPIGQKDVVGADGVMHVEPDATGGKAIEQIEIDVSNLGAGHFYDIREKKELVPAGGKISIAMPHGSGYPISILPYAVTGISSEIASTKNSLTVTWHLTHDAKVFTKHIIHVDVIDPDTKIPIPHFSQNIVCGESGAGSVSWPLAKEDERRKFSVSVHDILSGYQCTKGKD